MMEVIEAGGLLLVTSASRPGSWYRVDLTRGECQCKAWVFHPSRLCKHLRRASEWARARAAITAALEGVTA